MYNQTIEVKTEKRQIVVNITDQVKDVVKKSRVKEGICNLFTPHTTTGLTANENVDPNVLNDLIYGLENIIPTKDSNYTHVEENMAAHIKSSVIGPSLSLIIHDSELLLGKYQDIYLVEFDGPRTRKVIIGFLSDKK